MNEYDVGNPIEATMSTPSATTPITQYTSYFGKLRIHFQGYVEQVDFQLQYSTQYALVVDATLDAKKQFLTLKHT